ncbi:MAG: hypothetical protein JXA14_22410 [Anaerolineae bacterium]|nr:hypothetical protein [Anaerolineae bacterium]
MKRSFLVYARGLVVLLALLTLMGVPAWAQQIALRSVKPDSARAGEEVNLAIQGRGFCGPAQVRIGEFQAGDVQVESDSAINARVFIPEDAEPGPRDVEVVVDCGGPEETFSAVLPGGFTILGLPARPTPEPAGPEEPSPGPVEPGPPEPPPSGDWLLWLIILIVVGVIALGGGAAAVTIVVKARQVAQKKKWQQEAEEGELPEKCQSGKHKVIRDKPELKPGQWKVAGLEVTLYDEAQCDGERRGKECDVPDELVRRIDEAARNRLLWGDSERLTAEIVEIGQALAAQVIAWQARSQAGRDVRLESEIAGGKGSVKFTLYRCVGPPEWWQKVKSWQAKVQAVKRLPQEFRGPAAGEGVEAYRAVLEKGLTVYVRNLIREASRLWDTEGVGVSVEVSLE